MQFFLSELTKSGHKQDLFTVCGNRSTVILQNNFCCVHQTMGYVHKKNFHITVGTLKSILPNTSLCVVQHTVRTGKFCFQVQEKGSLRQFSAVLCITQLFSTVVLPKNHEVLQSSSTLSLNQKCFASPNVLVIWKESRQRNMVPQCS